MKKMGMHKDKRAVQLTLEQIVLIILVILGFVIALALYFLFPWKGTINRETCHQSVIFKATVPAPGGIKPELPLKCKTKKICITTNKLSKGDCEKELGSDYKSESVSSSSEKQKEQIKKIIADELYDCWWMMGEGKVQVFSRYVLWRKYSQRCVICSTIAFDKKIKATNPEIKDFYDYLKNEKIADGSYSYLDFLSKGLNPQDRGHIGREIDEPEEDLKEEAIDTSFRYSIIFKEFDRTALPEATGGIIGAIVSNIIRLKTGKLLPVSITTAAGLYVGGTAGGFVGGVIGDQYISTFAFVPQKEDKMADLNCFSFDSLA